MRLPAPDHMRRLATALALATFLTCDARAQIPDAVSNQAAKSWGEGGYAAVAIVLLACLVALAIFVRSTLADNRKLQESVNGAMLLDVQAKVDLKNAIAAQTETLKLMAAEVRALADKLPRQ